MKTFLYIPMVSIRLFYLIMIVAFMISCKSDTPSGLPDGTTTEVVPNVTIPAFNRDSAYQFIATQVSFGPRNLGSEGHEACKNWIVQKLTSYGVDVSEQDFKANLHTGEVFDATNIIGKINPSIQKRIVIAAHWDTRYIADQDEDSEIQNKPILGADDGGSGVAALIEIARVVQDNPVDLGIDLVFFDAEDQGASGGAQNETWCLGAQYWARNLASGNRPQYGILLDMIAAKGATFSKEGASLYYARSIVEKVWKLAGSMGYGHYFVNNTIGQLVDDHLFVNQIAGLPMIDIIHWSRGSFGAHWHTHDDDLDIIDKNVLGAVGQVVTALIYKESVGAI